MKRRRRRRRTNLGVLTPTQPGAAGGEGVATLLEVLGNGPQVVGARVIANDVGIDLHLVVGLE